MSTCRTCLCRLSNKNNQRLAQQQVYKNDGHIIHNFKLILFNRQKSNLIFLLQKNFDRKKLPKFNLLFNFKPDSNLNTNCKQKENNILSSNLKPTLMRIIIILVGNLNGRTNHVMSIIQVICLIVNYLAISHLLTI